MTYWELRTTPHNPTTGFARGNVIGSGKVDLANIGDALLQQVRADVMLSPGGRTGRQGYYVQTGSRATNEWANNDVAGGHYIVAG